MKSSDTLKLAGFTKEGVLDCLRLLYGGSITLTLLNFTDILKFGVYFQVPQFPDLCLSWVKVEKNVSSLLTVARVILENEELAEYCGANVWDVKSGRAGMKLLSICWRDKFDHNDLLRGEVDRTMHLRVPRKSRQFSSPFEYIVCSISTLRVTKCTKFRIF